MGQIFVNGVQYSGELTNATNIKYTGAASGLAAATVQGAIDELAIAVAQSDWNEIDSTQKDYIKNKPTIASGARTGSVMVGPNYVDNGTYLLAVGTGETTAANAHTLDQNGNAWFKGKAYIQGSSQSDARELAAVDYVQNQIATRAPLSHTHASSDLTGGYMDRPGYINIHPENNSPGILPFIYNDIAFLNKKGGSYKYYRTTDTDFTPLEITENLLNINTPENMFDGTPAYAYLQNGSDPEATIVIDLQLHQRFSYTTQVYIDFGNNVWSSTNIAFYVCNDEIDTMYTAKNFTTSNSTGRFFATLSHQTVNDSGATVYGFNRLRIVMSDFHSGSGGRIAEIGIIAMNSKGAAETCISRGGCNGIYGSLTPYESGLYSLGTNSKKWGNVYSNYLNSDQIVANGTLTVGASISAGGSISGNTLLGNAATIDTYCKVGNAKFTYDATNERVVISFE